MGVTAEVIPERDVIDGIVVTRNDAQGLESQAERIKALFAKHKTLLGAKRKMRPFKEPCMFFERRTGEVEFHEKVTTGLFEYTHSDGEKRFIIVNPLDQKKFGYGDYRFRGYWGHEDYPTTGRPDPLITAEQMNIIVEKSLNDIKKWKAQETRALTGLVWKIALGIAIVIGAIAVLLLLTQGNAPPPVQNIVPAAQNMANVTPTIILG